MGMTRLGKSIKVGKTDRIVTTYTYEDAGIGNDKYNNPYETVTLVDKTIPGTTGDVVTAYGVSKTEMFGAAAMECATAGVEDLSPKFSNANAEAGYVEPKN